MDRPLVQEVCEKLTLRVSNGNLNLPTTYLPTYLPTYLCDSSERSDSCDSSHSSHSSHSSDSCDSSDKKFRHYIFSLSFFPSFYRVLKIVTKLKNSNYDKSQKTKLWQNSKTQIVSKIKTQNTQNLTKLQNSNCDKTPKINLWQNRKTQIMTKLKNSKCDKTQKL